MPSPNSPRITVLDTLYYQCPGTQPFNVGGSTSKFLKSSEQPYYRRIEVGTELTKVDAGWLKECGMLFIKNEGLDQPTTIPTPQESEERAARVLEIYNGSGSKPWLLDPNDSFKGRPSNLDDLYIRCQFGTTRVLLYILPK